MADQKISQLQSIPLPLQSGDILPIVRDANTQTYNVSYANLVAAITGSIPAVDVSGLATTESLNDFTASYVADSGSVSNRMTELEATASASTASYAHYAVSASQSVSSSYASNGVSKINGISVVNNEITIPIGITITGTSSSLAVSSSGDVTSSLEDATVWIVSNETGSASGSNGNSYIWSSGSQLWYALATNLAVTDARYVLKSGDTLTGLLIGTSSFAQTSSVAIFAVSASQAISSSYPLAVTGSSIYSTYSNSGTPSNSSNAIWVGTRAGSGSDGANSSVFIGNEAGSRSNASLSNFIGYFAGVLSTNANNSNFIGALAGRLATNASNSNFFGGDSGTSASFASLSNFIGYQAGYYATRANNSNFLGREAGSRAASASYSTLIGHRVGQNVAGDALGIKSNNIIIGTSITLAHGRQDSINFGGLIFGTGSYSTTTGNPFSGSANGRIGINQPLPEYSLDVSGSGRFTNGLTASLDGTASWAVSASHALTSSYPFMVSGSVLRSWNAGSRIGSSTIAIGQGAANTSSGSTTAIAIGVGAGSQTQAPSSIMLGSNAGVGIAEASGAVMIGREAGRSSAANIVYNSAVVIGEYAGRFSHSGSYSTIIGAYAGGNAKDITSAIIVGSGSGNGGYNSHSIIIGANAGINTTLGSEYNILIGNRAGSNWETNITYLKNNNIVLGNNLYMPSGSANALNIGGVIFGSDIQKVPTNTRLTISGSANGRIGINQPLPEYSLDVSGSYRQIDGFTILSQVGSTLDFTNDVAAAAGGVPIHGLYRHGNDIKIRLT